MTSASAPSNSPNSPRLLLVVIALVSVAGIAFWGIAMLVMAGGKSYLRGEGEESRAVVRVVGRLRNQSAEEVERWVVEPLERKLNKLDGLADIHSTSVRGQADLVLTFEPQVELVEARFRVREAVLEAERDLPQDAEVEVH